MVSKFIFDDNRISLPSLEKSLNAYSARQKAIVDNISNAMTPGYKAKKVEFEDEYKKYLHGNKIDVKLTHEKHIPIGKKDLNAVKPRVQLQESTLNDTGLNNVDIEKEMVELAKNNLKYSLSVELFKKRAKNLTSSIKGR